MLMHQSTHLYIDVEQKAYVNIYHCVYTKLKACEFPQFSSEVKISDLIEASP